MAIKREDLIPSILNKVRQTFNDDKGWVRQSNFSTKPIQNFISKMNDDTGLYRQGKFTPIKALGDIKGTTGVTLKEAVAKLPEQAQQQWGQAGLVRNNPLLQKFAPKVIEPLATVTELGPAAYMNTWAKGVSTFARDTTTPQKAWDLLGVAGSLNPAYATKNLASGPLGVGMNAITNKLSGKPALENWKQGWQQGQEFQFHANPINQATGTLVNEMSKSVPFLQKFTETALKSNIQPTDKLGTAVGKWLSTSGRKVLKAAILETAVETPIWASMTKTDQETYVDALEREALQNLVMNTGMAGLSSIVDTRNLAPIVKKSIDDAATNYWKYATSPEGISKQGGYLNIFGEIVDGSSRTKLFDNAVYTLKENPNATPSEKGQATTDIINLAKRVLTNEEIKKIMGKKSGIYSGSTSAFDDLLDAVGKKIGDDTKMNKGYKEPFTIRNLLSNKGKTNEEILKSQSGKINLFGDIDTKQDTSGFPQKKIKLKTDFNQPIKTGGIDEIPKTIKTRRVSSISKTPYYEDTPIIRKEENITLYQGSKPGEQRQFWTPNKKYAEKFGDVKEKTGDFYLVDNGNMVTDVYVEVPNVKSVSPESVSPIKTGGEDLISEARKYKSAEDFVRDKVYSTFQAKNVNEGKQSYKNFLESRKGMEIDKKIIDNFNFFNTNEKMETLRAVETYNIDNLKGYPEVDLINRIKSSYGEVIGNNVEQISKENKALKLTDIWNKANLSPESVSPIKTGGVSNLSPESKGIKPALIDKKIDLGFEPKNIDIGKPAQQVEIPTTKVQTELPSPNKVSQSQDILPLPQGEIKQQIVKTKAQLKKVLAENPNANVRIELKPEKGKIITYGNIPDRADVAATLPNRVNSFIDDVLGYSTNAPKGGKREASLWTKTLRKGQTAITTKVEEGLGSENPYIRNGATFLQNFFRGLGMSPERQTASMELRGELGTANQRAYDVMDQLYKSLGNNKKSLERINAVLDPEISKIKISFDDLSKSEKEVYGLIREGLDLVHDTSYANGHISPELYAANKGKYVPRLYDVTELPPEVNQFVTQGKKINNNLYKQRKDINAWKIDNSLNDPVYALGKRLAQVETNTAIRKYTDFLASNPRFISDVERKGFTKLSDSPAYGSLAGKYVLNSAAEDLKGFFFSNQALQNLYDVFRAYDRMDIRQLQKKLLTVFNPTTNVGNVVSDQVFGFVTGVDPLTLNKNLINLKNNPSQFKQLNDYLMRKGITGTDITRIDFTNRLGSIDELASGVKPGKLKNISNKVQSFYGGTDDAYKVAALKSLLDKGFTLEEATKKVGDGFQNYANVGKFYDVASKIPVFGKPFIKFQGDLIRIIKNGAVNNPLGLITFLATLKGISYLSSKASGESDEDRKTRENRFGAPMIPGLNIPLTWQTPIGEINVARYISPFYANNETTNIASNMIPFIPDIDKNKDLASNIALNTNDPLLSPIVNLSVNRDFRGKPISDPNETKYSPSTLTSGEKLTNQALFAGRSYLPPPVNSAIDVGQVAMTGKNMYGTPQTLGQSVARLGGIKISQYGPEEVQALRDKDAEYTQYKNESLDKQVNSVHKQQLQGKITPEQAEKRILNLQSQKENVSVGSGGGVYRYIDDSSGSEIMRTVNIDKFNSMPEQTAYQRALKEKQKYTLVDDIMNNLTGDDQIGALQALGITAEDATYYNTARQENYLKSIYVEEEIMDMIKQGQNKDQILNNLVSMRKAVNEKILLSDGVINDLVDKNIISYTDGKALKNIDKDLTPKKTGTKVKKAKKISLSSKKFTASKKKYNPLKVKSTTTKSRFTPPKYVKADLRTPTKLL